jgi:acylphosphatase
VQGVSFRASMRQAARRQGVVGWVRNQPDGSVAFHAQGTRAAVGALLDWAQRGPPGARVDRLDTAEADPEAGLSDFAIRY